MRREHQREPSFGGDLHFILRVMRERRWVIVACVFLCTVAGLVYAETSPRIYAAKTALQIDEEEGKVVNIEGVKSEDLKSEETLKTFEQDIIGPEVLLRVIHSAELKDEPGFLTEVKDKSSDDALEQGLEKHVDAKIRRGTRLIDITVEDRNPRLAQKVAEVLVREFIEWNFEARRDASQMASAFLGDEATRLEERLGNSEKKLQQYKEDHAGVPLEEQQNITLDKLKELSLRETVAKAEGLKLEADCAQLLQLSKAATHSTSDLLAVPGIASTQAVIDLKKAVTDKQVELQALSERYRAEHPKYIQAKSELDALNADLSQAILKAADVLAASYQNAMLTEQKLKEAMQDQQQRTLEADQVTSGYTSLERNVESDRALYDAVKTRLKETDITKNIDEDAIRVVSHPLLPGRPVKPKKKLIVILSVAAGMALGCGLAFAAEAANRSFRSLEDAEERLGLRSLGEIPKIPLPRGRAQPALMETNFAAEESFRTLRTSLSLIGENPGLKTFLFTSARAGEGKTYCAIKCAMSFAQLGLKTLLIDADCRLPRIAKIFFNGTAGAAPEVDLDSLGSWERYVRETHIENLSVLSKDKDGLDPADFVSGKPFEDVMREAMLLYDRVVVDSAPVQEVSDTLLFAKHAQGVCLVIHAGRTPAEEVARASQRLEKAGAALVGFVWNQVTGGSSSYYYERAAMPRRGGREVNDPRTMLAVFPPKDGETHSSNGGNPSRQG